MAFSQRRFGYCDASGRELISSLSTPCSRGVQNFISQAAARAVSGAVLALLALGLLANLALCAQSQPRPADFKVNLVLFPTSNNMSDTALESAVREQARSGSLGVLRGPQLLIPLVSVSEYKRDSQRIQLTAECLAIGPDGKAFLDSANCGSANESNFKPTGKVTIPIHQMLSTESYGPGVYIFRVIVTDHVKGTSATVERRFTYALSGAAQASSRTAQTAPSALAPGTATLEGLYLARFSDERASWYLFKPSGAVAVDCRALIDPDDALRWPTYKVFTEQEAQGKGFHTFDCTLGKYRLTGNKLEVFAEFLSVDPEKKTKFRQQVYESTFDKKGEVGDLRFVDGSNQIQIGNSSFFRQADQTGRKLAGKFGYASYALLGNSDGHASFGSDGQFSMTTSSLYTGWGFSGSETGIGVPPTGKAEHGRYEIRGNEIIFQTSDRTTVKELFGDLGKDKYGREVVAIGGRIWTKGGLGSDWKD